MRKEYTELKPGESRLLKLLTKEDKMFRKFLKRMLKKIVKKRLADNDLQKVIVRKINKKVDLPALDEKAEAELFNQLYDALQEALLEVVDLI